MRRHRRMSFDERPPRRVDADANADARPPDHRSEPQAAILDIQSIADEIDLVFRERNPHRDGEIARSAT